MIAEQINHGVLLAPHTIALVGCAAAPLYNRNLVVKQGQYGPKLHYGLDKMVEDTLQSNAPYCIAFIATLFATGIGMPLNHYGFNRAFRALHPVATAALVLKLACVFAMIGIMAVIFLRLNPRLREIFAQVEPRNSPDPALEAEFFAKRTRRMKLSGTCLKFAVGVLVFSAFLQFSP